MVLAAKCPVATARLADSGVTRTARIARAAFRKGPLRPERSCSRKLESWMAAPRRLEHNRRRQRVVRPALRLVVQRPRVGSAKGHRAQRIAYSGLMPAAFNRSSAALLDHFISARSLD